MAKKATSAPQRTPAAPAVTTTPAPGAVQEVASPSQATSTPPTGTSPEVHGGFPLETNSSLSTNPHEAGASAAIVSAGDGVQPQSEVAPLAEVQPPRPYDEDELDAEELQAASTEEPAFVSTPEGQNFLSWLFSTEFKTARQPDPDIIAEAQKYKVASGAPSQAHKGPPRYALPQPPNIR